MIHASKVKNIVKTIPYNAFVIFVIFENNAINIESNSIIYVLKTLVFTNLILSVKKYYLIVYQKVNNFKLAYLKLYYYFYNILCQANIFYITRFFIIKISY